MLVQLAVQDDMLVHHMDVKTANLNADIDTMIFTEHPKGFIKADKGQKLGLNAQPTDFGGCPFATQNHEEILSLLESFYSEKPYLRHVMKQITERKPTLACKLLMKYSLLSNGSHSLDETSMKNTSDMCASGAESAARAKNESFASPSKELVNLDGKTHSIIGDHGANKDKYCKSCDKQCMKGKRNFSPEKEVCFSDANGVAGTSKSEIASEIPGDCLTMSDRLKVVSNHPVSLKTNSKKGLWKDTFKNADLSSKYENKNSVKGKLQLEGMACCSEQSISGNTARKLHSTQTGKEDYVGS
ncbi:hypothetical protein SK128_002907 [Halocaridina rubra]|uniref:Reverse transcriptase Ty1/copia-type domain-containing protein n=1 Tax=Halocaridina rubra TaxID=373956 RepID=A0AAN8WS89_HALRR